MATKNPYLDEFRQIQRGHREDRYMRRQELALKYAWAVPNEDVLRLMKDFAKGYVEIGAGTGYWASLLLSMNIKVDAYDDNSWKMSDPGKLWSPVHAGGPEMAAKHPKSALLLVWPPYKSSMGAFHGSSRNPVSTARPHTFLSIEYGFLADWRMGRLFSSA